MATCLEVGKASYPKTVAERQIDPLQGKSLLPILAGQERAPHDPLYFHFGRDRALRSGDWKIASAKMGRWELYNLAEDRTELHDLADQHPERVKKMAEQWHEIAKHKDRLPENQLKPVKETLTPLSFGKRRDPGAKGNR
jgi:arylsulfatase